MGVANGVATQSPKITFKQFNLILYTKSFLLIPHMTSIVSMVILCILRHQKWAWSMGVATQWIKIIFRHFILILWIKSFLLIPHMTSIDEIMSSSYSAPEKARASRLCTCLRGGCNSDHAWLFFGDSRHLLGPNSEGISLLQILFKFWVISM